MKFEIGDMVVVKATFFPVGVVTALDSDRLCSIFVEYPNGNTQWYSKYELQQVVLHLATEEEIEESIVILERLAQ